MRVRLGTSLSPLTRKLVALLFVAALTTGGTLAQEWSPAQKDVWKSVETYWELGGKRDTEGMLSYFHEDYLGWSNTAALPSGKKEVRKWISHEFATTKEIHHTIQPVGIKIHGDIAIVHYYFATLETNAKDEEKVNRGRWTDILKKMGDRWV
ncbi:MAG: nuclear transport factor 2 family protein, partial [Acidobacteriota bacterium]